MDALRLLGGEGVASTGMDQRATRATRVGPRYSRRCATREGTRRAFVRDCAEFRLRSRCLLCPAAVDVPTYICFGSWACENVPQSRSRARPGLQNASRGPIAVASRGRRSPETASPARVCTPSVATCPTVCAVRRRRPVVHPGLPDCCPSPPGGLDPERTFAVLISPPQSCRSNTLPVTHRRPRDGGHKSAGSHQGD